MIIHRIHDHKKQRLKECATESPVFVDREKTSRCMVSVKITKTTFRPRWARKNTG